MFYLKKIFSDIESANRTILNGKELDIYIPSLNIAIEYDGYKWHENAQKDIDKNNLCKAVGVTLYRIREPECPELLDNCSINIVLEKRCNFAALEKGIRRLFRILQIDDSIIDIDRDECKIREQYIKARVSNSLKSCCEENERYDLLQEWHDEKNGELKPENFSYGSRTKVWWKCKFCGHEWKAAIANRYNLKSGCPCCGRKRVGKTQTKRVRCIETNEIFNSLTETAKSKNVNIGHLSECCNGKKGRRSAGGDHWEYID